MWVDAQPMNAEEMLAEQARLTRSQRPDAKIFVYRNSLKALNWFSSVRTILDDPEYEPWFLKFKPGGVFPNGTWRECLHHIA
jgi:hypothetical protein